MAAGIRFHGEAIFMAGCVTVQGLSERLLFMIWVRDQVPAPRIDVGKK
jgi:hypothetical protein